MANETPKKNRRKLTPFLCQEMLYDFATDRLDNERKIAVQEFLKTDKECQAILEGINKAILFTEVLSKTEPSNEIQSHLKESENIASLGRKYSSWREWPDVMRWAIVCLLLVVCTAAIVSAVPWKKLSVLSDRSKSDTVEIAALTGPTPAQNVAPEGSGDEAAPEGSGDEETDVATDANDTGGDDSAEAGDEGAGAHATHVAAVPATQAPKTKPVVMAAAPPSATPIAPAAAAKPPAPSATASAPTPVEANDVSSSIADGHKDPKVKGFVYRAFMALPDLEKLGPKISSDIEQLGGEKAGEVELGWKRGTGRYYHFAIPEANQEKLLERLRAYGPVRLSKDAHPRVMPKGQVRFILWVEANGN